jgi:hypothetical protein
MRRRPVLPSFLPPVSLVQPVSGIGLVVLAVLAHVFLNERLSAGEWAAAGVATAGAALLSATSPPAPPPPSAQRLVAVLALSTLAVLIGPSARARLAAARRARRAGPRPRTPSKPPPAPSATAQGARAGVVFGLGATACRAGFALGGGRPPVVAAGVASSTLLSALGMAIQTAALKTGASVGVCTAAAVSSMLSGAALGIAALGEPFAPSPSALPARITAWALTLAGVAALAGGGVTKVAAGAVPPALRARLPVRVAAALRRAASASLPTRERVIV